MMEDLKQYLHIGSSKSTFGEKTNRFLSELENTQRGRESRPKFPRLAHLFQN